MKNLHGLHPDERKQKILDMLKTSDSVNVPELTDLFGVTGATIRNDLRELESAEKLIRTHGGAISFSRRSFEEKPENRPHENMKKEIARKALEFIHEGDSIILDTGTTTLELARQIALAEIKGLKVVTNDFQIAGVLEFSSDIELFMCGGRVRKDFHCTVGYQAIRYLKQFSVDKAFIGTTACSVKDGFSTPNISVSEIKEVILTISKQVFVLCDSSKIGKSSFYRFASVGDIDVLITDSAVSPALLEEIERCDISVEISQADNSKVIM